MKRAAIVLVLAAVVPGCGKKSSSSSGPAPLAPVVSFISAAYSGAEGGIATITAERTGGDAAVSVTYATSAGTAAAGTDYAQATGSLSWAAGDYADKTFTVTIAADSIIEGSETVTLTLSGATIGGTNPATLTIADAPGVLRFTAAAFSDAEGATAAVTVERVEGSGGVVGVSYATSNGTASGSDYSGTTGSLSWAAGETGSKSFNVALTQDATLESNETVVLTLSSATGGATIGGTNPAALTIVDDDNPGTVQFSAAAFSVSEAGLLATITVTRTGGAAGAASVTYADAGGGTATGADYSMSGGTLNWAAGDAATKSFTVSITADAVSDDGETVNLSLSAATGASLGGPSTATLTIIEPPVVTSSDPANGTPNVSLAANLKLTFSKAMDAAATEAAISLSPAPAGLAFFWSGNSVTIAVDTTAPAGIEGDDLLTENTAYTLSVSAGALSSTGIAMAAGFSTSFTTKPDATLPSIVSITPDPSALLANPVTQFVVVFSEAMNTSNGTAQTQIKAGIDSVWASASAGNPSATLTVTWTNSTTLTLALQGAASPLPSNRAFSLEMGSLSDASGNWMSWASMPLVTAGSDAVAPTITGRLPADGSTNVSRDTGIFIGFSEAMAPGIGSHITITGAGSTLYDVKQETLAVFITPRKAWPANATIQVNIAATAEDASGNGIAASGFSFTTAAADVSPMVVDAPYSTLADGLTGVSQGALGDWIVRFKNSVSGKRAWLNAQDLKPEDVAVVELATGIPLKGYAVRMHPDTGGLEIRSRFEAGLVGLLDGTTYSVTLKGSLQNSAGIALTPVTMSFTTAVSGANRRPKFESPCESKAEVSEAGETVGLRATVRNSDAADTLTVTASSAVEPFTPALAGPSPWGGDFQYETAGADEAAIVTPGWHALTYTLTDGFFTETLKDDVFVFDKTALPTLTGPSDAQATNTPTFTWTAAPADAQALVLVVTDALGSEAYSAAFEPTATSFTLPADRALPAGSYTWTILMVRLTKDDGMRIGVAAGFGAATPVAFSTP